MWRSQTIFKVMTWSAEALWRPGETGGLELEGFGAAYGTGRKSMTAKSAKGMSQIALILVTLCSQRRRHDPGQTEVERNH
jgi:hypothetical protein